MHAPVPTPDAYALLLKPGCLIAFFRFWFFHRKATVFKMVEICFYFKDFRANSSRYMNTFSFYWNWLLRMRICLKKKKPNKLGALFPSANFPTSLTAVWSCYFNSARDRRVLLGRLWSFLLTSSCCLCSHWSNCICICSWSKEGVELGQMLPVRLK